MICLGVTEKKPIRARLIGKMRLELKWSLVFPNIEVINAFKHYYLYHRFRYHRDGA